MPLSRLAILVPLLLCGTAAGVPAYSYVTDRTSASPGSTVSVYLQESLGPGDTSRLSADGGLLGAGFSVQYGGGRAPLAITAITPNPALFTGPTAVTLTPTAASVLQAIDFNQPLGVMPDGSGRILLGTFTVSASAVALPVAFSIGRYDELGGNTLTLAGTDLDFDAPSAPLTGAATRTSVLITVAVPEPVSVLVMLPAATLLGRRVLVARRRI